ncbi:hypothetical protein PR202_ga16663 [Eleusine coracana subsp. coracana]|uniref:DCD domain-containing protein n=1 Tax=Eleusine coracana subsp. coracana TaxID=191504 RepID=A0AAV5CNB4_ELECO|nr:hypothetical protein PR202_ga16663 [Eleusine coracana subsp. coracana]
MASPLAAPSSPQSRSTAPPQVAAPAPHDVANQKYSRKSATIAFLPHHRRHDHHNGGKKPLNPTPLPTSRNPSRNLKCEPSSILPSLLSLCCFLLFIYHGLRHGGWASNGGLNINRDAFQHAYPAQVRISIIWKCRPLSEDEFSPAIEENYYLPKKFYFDLSFKQRLSEGKALPSAELSQQGIPAYPDVPEFGGKAVIAVDQQKNGPADYISLSDCGNNIGNAPDSSDTENDMGVDMSSQQHIKHAIGAESNTTVPQSSVFSRIALNKQPSQAAMGPTLTQLVSSLSQKAKDWSDENGPVLNVFFLHDQGTGYR